MPEPETPIPDLSSQLFSLLLRSAGGMVLAAAIVGLGVWLLQRARPDIPRRVHQVLFEAKDAADPEPSARRFLRICLGLLWVFDGLLQAQRDMPGGFIPREIAPGIASSPNWLGDLVAPLARTWIRHPITADAITVWIQVGLGLLILCGGRGLLSRVALWASVVWALAIWVVGEFLGGLLEPGASWLVGAPGAVIAYVLAAGLLLAPWAGWESGRIPRLARIGVGAWLLLGALLQAVPWEQSWSARGLSKPFSEAANTAQPALLKGPISTLATWSTVHPAVVNGVLIAVLVAVGVGLCISANAGFVVAGVVVCAATWWLAQDFGVLGGTGTDPDAALPLALLLVSTLPGWSSAAALRAERDTAARSRRASPMRQPVMTAMATLGLGALIVAPLLVTRLLFGPADAAAVTADSGGGVIALAHRPAPDFTLTDQNGRSVSMQSLRGKLIVLTFLDPVCSDECPVIANQLAIADSQIGALGAQVEFVAIDTNPVFHEVADVAAFTTSHGLNVLPNWHFLAGPQASLQDLLTAYGISVAVPTVGMIEHSEGIYFISNGGSQVAYLGDGANADLTTSYGDRLRNEIRTLLK
jgi:cytochrome oxidase Cu insertion factor (SCO1/SenC/PrrC family)